MLRLHFQTAAQGEVFQVGAAFDLRLRDIVVDLVAQVRMRLEQMCCG
jgi:hypothetical protein